VAKSLYSPEKAQAIFDAIATHGGDKDGWKAGGIHRATFYSWLNQHSDFRDGVARAKAQYRTTRPARIKEQAERAFEDYLFGRVVEQHESIKREPWLDKLGKPILNEDGTPKIKTTVTKTTFKRGIPEWAITRVLGKAFNSIEALQTLVDEGWIPSTVLQEAIDGIGDLRAKVQEAFKRNEQRPEA
jgi:hypothetical protein